MRKFLTMIITACILCGTVGLTACGDRSADGHNWSGEWTSDINKHWHKCLDTGCKGRNGYEDHDWVLTTTYVAANCGEAGAGQYTCSGCQATLGNTVTPAKIPATGEHDYKLVEVDVEASCGEDGYGWYLCGICYDYTLLTIPATGEHDYDGKYVGIAEGHYHACGYGCGDHDELLPHVKGEGERHEPVGTKDGRIDYKCTECGYLIESVVIPNPNVLSRFEVRFVKSGSGEIVTPELGEYDELYVTLKVSSNASTGYTLSYTGYSATDNEVTMPSVKLYYYNDFTGEKKELDISNMGSATGYMGYVNGGFYISRTTDDVVLLLECTPAGRETVSLKVHIKAVF